MKLKFVIIALAISSGLFSQESKLEPAISGVQMGVLGAWFVYEPAITNHFSFRMEAGLDIMGIGVDGYFDRSTHTVLSVEPRWYYNIEKRMGRGKTTTGNSANFLAFTSTYSPHFQYGLKGDIFDEHKFIFSPKWGIRRSITQNIHYEAGIGFGYALRSNDPGRWEYDLHLRIGYSFF